MSVEVWLGDIIAVLRDKLGRRKIQTESYMDHIEGDAGGMCG